MKVPKMGTSLYEVIVKLIVQQQVSVDIAFRVMIANLVKRFGERVIWKGENYYAFPIPAKLAKASILELKGCGLSSKKAEYIINFSREVANGNFNPEELMSWDEEKIWNEMSKFKGIGRWTMRMIMVAGLGIGQAPPEDLGIRKAISEYYFNGELQSAEVVQNFIKRWKGLRYLSVYLLYAYRIGLKI